MKRLLSLLLCLILCFCLFSCNEEKSNTSEKSTKVDSTKNTPVANNNETNSKSPMVDINKLSSVSITSDSLSKTFVHARNTEPIKKLLSYLNGLELKLTTEEPTDKPIAIIKANYLDSYSTKTITIHLFESGKKIGFSNLHNEKYNEEIMSWYDVLDTNIIKPLDFLDSFYTPILVSNGRFDFGDKEVSSCSLLYYSGLFAVADHVDELKFKSSEKLQQLMDFFKNLNLGDPVESSGLNENHSTGYFNFYFDDGSFSEVVFQYSYYLIIDKKCYDIGDTKRSELYEILSTPIWY